MAGTNPIYRKKHPLLQYTIYIVIQLSLVNIKSKNTNNMCINARVGTLIEVIIFMEYKRESWHHVLHSFNIVASIVYNPFPTMSKSEPIVKHFFHAQAFLHCHMLESRLSGQITNRLASITVH